MPMDNDNVPAQTEFSSLDLLVLNTSAVKFSAFWPDSAEAWFIQMEAQFDLIEELWVPQSSITGYPPSNKRTNQVLYQIKSPPAYEPYKAQKRRLFKLFALNDYQRYEAICSLPLSGDMKPSKLMSSMLALCQRITNPFTFSVELFSSFYKSISELTTSGMTSVTTSP